MNWMTHGTTNLVVGFEKHFQVCEGGNCEHLKPGDKAYGHSSENDSMGSEVYLMCEPCFEKFLEDEKNQLVDCHDCCKEFPRKETKYYKAYDTESIEAEIFRADICLECWAKERHQERLRRDKEDRDRDWEELYGDQESMDDDEDDDQDDENPEVDHWDEVYYWAREYHKKKRYSKCIEIISVYRKIRF